MHRSCFYWHHCLMFWSNCSFNVKNHKTRSRPCRGGESAPCDPRQHHVMNINNQTHQMTARRRESGSVLPWQRKMSQKIKGHCGPPEDENRREKPEQDSESLTDTDLWPSNRTSLSNRTSSKNQSKTNWTPRRGLVLRQPIKPPQKPQQTTRTSLTQTETSHGRLEPKKNNRPSS